MIIASAPGNAFLIAFTKKLPFIKLLFGCKARNNAGIPIAKNSSKNNDILFSIGKLAFPVGWNLPINPLIVRTVKMITNNVLTRKRIAVC